MLSSSPWLFPFTLRLQICSRTVVTLFYEGAATSACCSLISFLSHDSRLKDAAAVRQLLLTDPVLIPDGLLIVARTTHVVAADVRKHSAISAGWGLARSHLPDFYIAPQAHGTCVTRIGSENCAGTFSKLPSPLKCKKEVLAGASSERAGHMLTLWNRATQKAIPLVVSTTKCTAVCAYALGSWESHCHAHTALVTLPLWFDPHFPSVATTHCHTESEIKV